MIKNVGSWDRVLRVVVGSIFVALAYTGTLGPWAYIGAATIVTGLIGWCPPYTIFGINTCSVKLADKQKS